VKAGKAGLRRWLIAGAIATCSFVSLTDAQERRWEIEGYGGLAAQTAGAGSQTLPPAGAPIVTSNPIFPSRETSSWFFGDGAALLNGVNAEFGAPGRITPLDSILSALPGTHAAGIGFRLRRRLDDRLSAEVSVDTTTSSGAGSERLTAAVDAARSSFKAAFGDLLGTGPFSGVAIDATGASHSGFQRDTAITAAINARITTWGSVAPYVTVGGGVLVPRGTLPSATLEGHYRFSILGQVPIEETDRISMRYTRGTAWAAVFGGGVRREFSSRWGLRVDARLLVGPDPTRAIIDAHPSIAHGTPSGFVESFTNPAIQFSNDPSTGRVSSLSGAALDGFQTFKGGTQTKTMLTVGVFRRF